MYIQLPNTSKVKVKSSKTLPAYVCGGMKELQQGKWLHTNFSLLFLSFYPAHNDKGFQMVGKMLHHPLMMIMMIKMMMMTMMMTMMMMMMMITFRICVGEGGFLFPSPLPRPLSIHTSVPVKLSLLLLSLLLSSLLLELLLLT